MAQIKGESRAVNLWAVDYPSFARISGGFDIVEGRALEEPNDLVMDTILAERHRHAGRATSLPMLNREFRVAGICRAGAGGRLYARIEDVQEAIGTPGKAVVLPGEGPLRARRGEPGPGPAGEVQGAQDHARGPGLEGHAGQRGGPAAVQGGARPGMAVVISFLVVLLAMYTTIIERTREIGILRAIGASQGKVVQLVIGESFLICLAGVARRASLLALAGRWLLPFVFPTLTVQLTREWAAHRLRPRPRRRPAGIALPGGRRPRAWTPSRP